MLETTPRSCLEARTRFTLDASLASCWRTGGSRFAACRPAHAPRDSRSDRCRCAAERRCSIFFQLHEPGIQPRHEIWRDRALAERPQHPVRIKLRNVAERLSGNPLSELHQPDQQMDPRRACWHEHAHRNFRGIHAEFTRSCEPVLCQAQPSPSGSVREGARRRCRGALSTPDPAICLRFRNERGREASRVAMTLECHP